MLLKIGSVTRTARAKDILGGVGITARAKKLSNRLDGCVYALEVQPQQLETARKVLAANGIGSEQIKE